MECILCGEDAKYRRIKGMPVCRKCQQECREGRDKINKSIIDVKNKYNTTGETLITSRQVILKVLSEREKTNETV